MKRALAIAVAGASLWMAAPAAASSRYQAFGNLTYNDCQYEAAANLVLYHDARAKITTGEVLRAWRKYRIVGPAATPGGLDFLENVGFAGWRVSSARVTSSRSAIIAAANSGGVFAALGWGHAVAVIHANARKLVVVDDGIDPPMEWGDFHQFFDTPGTTLYALTWARTSTEQVNFDGTSTTSDSPTSMASIVEATGSTVALPANVFVNDGYAFQGWSSDDSNRVQYANGANYTFTRGATLYAVWTYCGTMCT